MSAGTSYASSKMESDRVPDKFPVGMKVLLVDDDLTCLTVVKRMLVNCQYDVTTCSEATRALSLLRENKVAFDLIISDVHMPDMDGFRLLELVGLEMDLPVIMMSGDTRFNVVMKGVSHGACDFLSKPVRMEELQNIWQHVVRRKWFDSKENERSGSVEEIERNRQGNDDSEYASAVNDGTDSSWKYQKKKRDAKEDDDGELDSVDPSSSKKPRVVWSVELHQQFVNAVNQLGIDKAVPKRILELMNVPGLTRENVASHLQKFRLYLKRLSGVAQHQNGFNNTLCGASSNAKVAQMGRLDFQALAVQGQISPQTLAALQDELFGRPSRGLAIPAMNQPIVQPASAQENNCVTFERGIAFGQPLLKGQALSSFPVWSSNNLGAVVSASNIGGLSTSQNSNVPLAILPQPQLQTVSSEANHANVQPSCLVAPTKSSNMFQVQGKPMLSQESLVASSQSSASFQSGNAVVPGIQDSVVVTQSATSLKTGNNTYVTNLRSTILPSQSLTSISVGTDRGLLNQGSVIIPSQPLNNSQTGSNPFLINQNSMIVPSQLSSTFQTEKKIFPISRNSLNKDSSHANYNRLPTQSNIISSSMGQILDSGFDGLAMVNGFSVPVSKTSETLSSTGSSTSWQLHSPEGIIGRTNGSPSLVPNSCNVQPTDSVLGKLPDKGQGKNLGFVGKGTCLPSRFAVDDVESPTNELTNSSVYTGDDAYLLNQDVYGALQSGPCATTSFK